MKKIYKNTTQVLLAIMLFCACSKKENKNHALLLDNRYQQINNIYSFAKCNGPNGNYITEVISKKNGYLFFSQLYIYNDNTTFIAELTSDKKGYVIDENRNVIDTLLNISIEMIRSHDFHRLLTNPNHFLNNIKFKKKESNNIELFTAIDNLNNPVKIYYNRSIKQLESITFLNMIDTTETIKIRTIKQIDSEFGKIAKEIEIVQAKKDTFNFNFEKIEINKKTY